jgi:hypothetical protein
MRTHYGPWQPCWISNQHQKHKSGRGPSSEHFWQVWLISVQRLQRRRFKCEKLTDVRTTDAYPWQKLTWPMARWANNQFIFLYFRSSSHLSKLTHFWQFSVSESLSKRFQHYFQMNLKSFLVRCTHYGLLSFCYSTVKINVTSTSTEHVHIPVNVDVD